MTYIVDAHRSSGHQFSPADYGRRTSKGPLWDQMIQQLVRHRQYCRRSWELERLFRKSSPSSRVAIVGGGHIKLPNSYLSYLANTQLVPQYRSGLELNISSSMMNGHGDRIIMANITLITDSIGTDDAQLVFEHQYTYLGNAEGNTAVRMYFFINIDTIESKPISIMASHKVQQRELEVTSRAPRKYV
jgi:hypothetical protein